MDHNVAIYIAHLIIDKFCFGRAMKSTMDQFIKVRISLLNENLGIHLI